MARKIGHSKSGENQPLPINTSESQDSALSCHCSGSSRILPTGANTHFVRANGTSEFCHAFRSVWLCLLLVSPTVLTSAGGTPPDANLYYRRTKGVNETYPPLNRNTSDHAGENGKSAAPDSNLVINGKLSGSAGSLKPLLANGIDPNNLGKGDWIWEMPSCESALGVSTPQAVIAYEANKGVQWITVKGADGGNTNSWTQFNPTLVSQAHAAGLKIFVWVYCYGNYYGNLQGEIDAALTLLGEGADGLIIDAETEYEGQPAAATQYCQAIRARYPDTFLAYAPFPYISYHTSFPYIEFGTYCDAAMPQDYWADIGVSVPQMVQDMDSQWSSWQNNLNGSLTNAIKPIIPVGQGWNSSGYVETTADVTNFVYLLKTDPNPATEDGYHGVSFWSCQHHTAAIWAGIAESSIGTATPEPPAITAQPNPRTVLAGSKVVFAVGASGTALTYHWLKNGTVIPTATSFAYTLANAQSSNQGSYSVIVSNSLSSVTSAPVTLTVSTGLHLYPTNLVLIRVGDGTQALTLNGNSIFLDQFAPDGTYVNTVNLPDSGPSAMVAIGWDNINGVNSGSTTGSSLTRSLDRRFMVVAGYNTNLNYGASLVNSLAADVPRGIGLIDSDAQVLVGIREQGPDIQRDLLARCCDRRHEQFLGRGGQARNLLLWF